MTTPQSDTPRTDVTESDLKKDGFKTDSFPLAAVLNRFRQLERELNAAKEELACCHECYQTTCEAFGEECKECDAAKGELSKWKDVAGELARALSDSENYIRALNASWQSTFCYGVNSPEEIDAGKKVVTALRHTASAEKALTAYTALTNEHSK